MLEHILVKSEILSFNDIKRIHESMTVQAFIGGSSTYGYAWLSHEKCYERIMKSQINSYNTFLNPGDKVYYITHSQRLIIPCIVLDVDDILSNVANPKCPTVWRYRYGDGRVEAKVPTDEMDENGWPVWRDANEEDLSGYKQVNQFLWICEPVGHGISLGDECFLTLNEAMKWVVPSRKKHLKRRLNTYRKSIHRFIAHTWEINGERHPGFPKLPLKKVYVRNA